MRLWLVLLVLAGCALPVSADVRLVTKLSVNGQEGLSTEYLQGRNVRWESVSDAGAGHRPTVTILNLDRKVQYVLDVRAKQYVESAGYDLLLTLAMWIRRSPRVRESGKTVDIYVENIDTGERRETFGHTARHLISRERHVPQPGACSQDDSEIDKDGWYIEWPHGTARHEARLEADGGHPCRDKVVWHGTQIKSGFPLLETTINGAASSTGLPAQPWSIRREVIEFSEDPLDQNLFRPPHDFRRVSALPGEPSMSWTQHFDFERRELEQSFESWFD